MFLTNCSETKTTYKVKGTIYEIKKDLNKIRIAHDTIPGLMMPMEMDFNILNNKSVNYLSIGDSVHFNPQYEKIKGMEIFIELKDNLEIWKIIENRIKI